MTSEKFRFLAHHDLTPEWKRIAYRESVGSAGETGVIVHVKGTPEDLTEDEAYDVQRLAGSIHELLETYAYRRDPRRPAQISENAALLTCFDQPIYVEPISNGYCNRSCCEHLPWFVVTTGVGRIKIGWRKRVISIDYTDTRVTQKAEDLFKDRTMTRYDKEVHASDYDDARLVIQRIVAAAPVSP